MAEYEVEKFEESLKDKIYSIPRASGNAGQGLGGALWSGD